MSDQIDPRDFGRLESDVHNLTKTVEAIATDMKAVRSAVDSARGGWKMLVAVGTVSGTIAASIVKILAILPLK